VKERGRVEELRSVIGASEARENHYLSGCTAIEGRLAKKHQEIARLNGQITECQFRLERIADAINTNRAPWIDGAEHIRIDPNLAAQLRDDETAIYIGFQDFTFDEGVLGGSRCTIALEFGFYEHNAMRSKAVDPACGNFNTTVLFPCRNDMYLRHYIQTGTIVVDLYTIRGMREEKIASGKIDLRPFLEKKSAFTSRMDVERDGHVIGTVSYEALIFMPLLV
jgi:hypothetical protein